MEYFLVIFGSVVIFGVLFYFSLKNTNNTHSTSLKSSEQRKKNPPRDSTIPNSVIEEMFDEIVDDLVGGNYSNRFSSNVLLKKGERLIFDISGITLSEERTVKMGGQYHGISVRVMKGLSYRTGMFSGGVEQKVVPIDDGNITLTNKRLIFTGEKNSKTIPLTKINSIEPLDIGFMLSREGKQKTEYYTGTTNLSMNITISPDTGETFEEGVIVYEMNGMEFRKIVQKLLQE
jgi:hypothetical protein